MCDVLTPTPFPLPPTSHVSPELHGLEQFDIKSLCKASEILSIINQYRTPCSGVTEDRSDEGNLKFLAIIYGRVRLARHIQLVLPAFPFKSPNRVSKVLGSLPDKAEEFALAHLDGLCANIAQVYEPGAKLVIASDGLVYNDLLGVPESDVRVYGQELRRMVDEHDLHHIEFVDLRDFLGWKGDTPSDAAQWDKEASMVRTAFIQNYCHTGDIDRDIATDSDICGTYRGYIKFLSIDLALAMEGETKSSCKKKCAKIAKLMLSRGASYAQAIAKKFPDHVRLSIHPANGAKKISISILPSVSDLVTPWHSCLCIRVDGSITASHRDKFESNPELELVYKDGRPWYFREKSDLYSKCVDIMYEPNYPCGLTIRPAAGSGTVSIANVDMRRIRSLAQANSPIVLRGFTDTKDRSLFIKKAEEMGNPVSWKFGLILEVEDRGTDSAGLNNVLSAEWMPFHYDGLFKIVQQTDAGGKNQPVSLPPKFQFFTALTPSPKGTGYTLFSPSRLVFDYLPRRYTVEKLQKLTWTVRTPSFDQAILKGLPLIVSHEDTGRPCLRYHERWPQTKTRFEPTEVELEDVKDSMSICDMLENLLHDRRVCYWHSWEDGDCLISDNTSVLHTRSSFESGSSRSLRRIHVD